MGAAVEAQRVLLVSWCSFADGEATAGDALAADAARDWLASAGYAVDVAVSPNLDWPGVQLDAVDPCSYRCVVFVCGPASGPPLAGLHRRFAGCRRIAVGVSVLDGAAEQAFDVVIARDGTPASSRVDLAAAAPLAAPPVVGVCLAHGQAEYGARQRHAQVDAVVGRLVTHRDCAPVAFDTRLAAGARPGAGDWAAASTSGQVGALVRRCDLVVTSRMHGLVLALRMGIPVLALDPITGGAKVSAQARAWGWPAVLTPGQLRRGALDRAWDWCLSTAGAEAARQAGVGIEASLAATRDDLLAAVGQP